MAAVFDNPAAGDDVGGGLELTHLLDQPYDFVLPLGRPLAARDAVEPEALAERGLAAAGRRLPPR